MSDPIEDGPSAPAGRGGRLRAALGIGFTVLILVALAKVADAGALAAALRAMDVRLVLLALGVTILMVLLVAVRWRLTLAASGVSVRLGEAVAIVLSASAMNAVSPSKAGDLIKVYALRDRTTPWVTLGAMVVERTVDIAALGLIAAPAAALSGQPALALFGLALVVGPLFLAPLTGLLRQFPLPVRFKDKLEAFASAVQSLARQPRLLAILIAFALAIWGAMICVAWLLYHAVGATPSIAQTAAALPLGVLAGLSPITVAGIGTRDAALMWLMSAHSTQAQSLGASLMYTAVVYWAPALCGAPFVLRVFMARRLKRRP